jgi:hypothetical protein
MDILIPYISGITAKAVEITAFNRKNNGYFVQCMNPF